MRCTNLLVAHDLSPHAELLLAALLGREVDAGTVHLVHVLPRVDPSWSALTADLDDDVARRTSAAIALHETLGDGPWARATVHVEIGDPATRIVALAESLDADLIALATHGRHGLERLALGSVAEHVVRFAPCPVVVFPNAALDAERATTPLPQPASAEGIEEQVEVLGIDICGLVERTPGHLTALQIGLPEGADLARFEEGLVRWLGTAGISFVDLAFARTIGDTPRVLRARFEHESSAP